MDKFTGKRTEEGVYPIPVASGTLEDTPSQHGPCAPCKLVSQCGWAERKTVLALLSSRAALQRPDGLRVQTLSSNSAMAGQTLRGRHHSRVTVTFTEHHPGWPFSGRHSGTHGVLMTEGCLGCVDSRGMAYALTEPRQSLPSPTA